MPTLKVLDTYPGWEKLKALPLKPAKEHEPPLREGQLFVVVDRNETAEWQCNKGAIIMFGKDDGSFSPYFSTKDNGLDYYNTSRLARIPEYDYTAETPADHVVIPDTLNVELKSGDASMPVTKTSNVTSPEKREFKVGDRVRIRAWEDMEKEFGLDDDGDIKTYIFFVKNKKHLCGRVDTIKLFYNSGILMLENYDEAVSADMLEHADEPAKKEPKPSTPKLTFTITREQEITDSDGIKYERNKITFPNWKATGEFTPDELQEHLKLGRQALERQAKQFSK